MTSPLHETIGSFSDTYLIEQLHLHRDQYTREAIGIMEEEMGRRKITREQIDAALSQDQAESAAAVIDSREYDRSAFQPLDGAFTVTDATLVRTMLSEHKVPFLADTAETLLPFDGEELDAHRVTFLIHKEYLESAQAIIAEHFELAGKGYGLKYSDSKTRLKSFNFYEIPRFVIDSREIVSVVFSTEEKKLLMAYGERLLQEVDAVEEAQGRVVFYYDSLEDLIGRLGARDEPRLTHTDLLTSLEILQIYCDEPDFPAAADGLIEALLRFFSSIPK